MPCTVSGALQAVEFLTSDRLPAQSRRELLFQESEAYRLALKLYAGRYEVIACKDVADIMREAIEKHMPDSDQQTESEDDDTEGQASE